MRLRFTSRARADLDEIAHYLRPLSARGASNVQAAIRASIDDLLDFPRIGRLQTGASVRKLVVRKYPYLIYYTINDADAEIVVISIRHAARRRDFSDE
jgi:toxin ParE1/3/4